MWTCTACGQKFLNENQNHSCNDRTVEDFLANKSEKTIELYHYFIDEFRRIGDFDLHPAKSRIAFAAKIRFGYINRLGRDFVDIAFTFNQSYNDNLCFYRIGEVPGGKYFQHYLRIFDKEDLNDEVRMYMEKAWQLGMKKNSLD